MRESYRNTHKQLWRHKLACTRHLFGLLWVVTYLLRIIIKTRSRAVREIAFHNFRMTIAISKARVHRIAYKGAILIPLMEPLAGTDAISDHSWCHVCSSDSICNRSFFIVTFPFCDCRGRMILTAFEPIWCQMPPSVMDGQPWNP